MGQLLLLVTYKCRQGMRESFLENIKAEGITDCIRREKGFIRYDYFYSETDPSELLLVEKWESSAEQQAHLQTEHMLKFKHIKDKYVAETSVEKILL